MSHPFLTLEIWRIHPMTILFCFLSLPSNGSNLFYFGCIFQSNSMAQTVLALSDHLPRVFLNVEKGLHTNTPNKILTGDVRINLRWPDELRTNFSFAANWCAAISLTLIWARLADNWLKMLGGPWIQAEWAKNSRWVVFSWAAKFEPARTGFSGRTKGPAWSR